MGLITHKLRNIFHIVVCLLSIAICVWEFDEVSFQLLHPSNWSMEHSIIFLSTAKLLDVLMEMIYEIIEISS